MGDDRRAAVRAAHLNGFDLVTVGDDPTTLTVTLFGKAPHHLHARNLRIDDGERITGIVVTDVHVTRDDDPELPDLLRVNLNKFGDLSAYTLSIVEPGPNGKPGTRPYPGFDPKYARIGFTFAQNCPAQLDCAGQPATVQPDYPSPDIDYLAKDYASFRQLLLNRLSLLAPTWTERHLADLGMTVVELMAYVGDQLSYYQDAVGTEAYLGTARTRISVHRHARLVDYRMHDGVNARAFVAITTTEPVILPADGFRLLALPQGLISNDNPALTEADLTGVSPDAYQVFEPMLDQDVPCLPAHNEIALWTWGERDCTLPAGATAATLRDQWTDATHTARALQLSPGDVLIFEEVRGRQTGVPADADPHHRQAVRLTSVTRAVDHLFDRPVLAVRWSAEDALTVPLLAEASAARGNVLLVDNGSANTWCNGTPERLTMPIGPAKPEPGDCGCGCGGDRQEAAPYPPVAVPADPVLAGVPVTRSVAFPDPARVAAGQARYLRGLPAEVLAWLADLHRAVATGTELSDVDVAALTLLFGERTLRRVRLAHHPLDALATLHARFDEFLAGKLTRLRRLIERALRGYVLGADIDWEIAHTWSEPAGLGLSEDNPAFLGPASAALVTDPRVALPSVTIAEQGDAGPAWMPVRDLLASGPTDRAVVGETDDSGALHLRFGDGTYGEPPTSGATLLASYRVGNGSAGNVGAGAINRVLCCLSASNAITAVRNPLPAVGGVDPEPVDTVRQLAPTAMHGQLLRAITSADYAQLAAALPGVRRAAADLRWTGAGYQAQVAIQPEVADPALLAAVRHGLHPFRRIGHDLSVRPAPLVPLDIELCVLVDPDYLVAHVRAALLSAFGTGPTGFFRPGQIGFGTAIRESRLVATATALPGVISASVTKLQRLFAPPAGELAAGILTVGPLEIAELDNDPDRPERGRLTFTIGGGR
ncbi:MAG TPA: putative baseplate assembly protein [Pseudonocardiaceae bacterium]|jgi:predicted phage baseplate assembly protein